MTADAPQSWRRPATAYLPSPWMDARERRQRQVYVVWVACLTISVVVGLVNVSWWWLAAGIVSVRGVVLAMFWLRVAAARHRTARTGRVTVLAAVCRDQVCPSARPTTPSWDELLVGGLLEADQDGWLWRPSMLAWGGYSCLRLARRDVVTVSTAFAFDPGMPPGDYVQVTTQDGPPVDLLVWDYRRVPPIQAWLAPR